jgi:hypothetical protein
MRIAFHLALLGILAFTGCGGTTHSDGGVADMAAAMGGGTIQFTASGEVLALGGYAFPPATAGAPAFVDGWQIKFDELIVTLDKIVLSENPDTSPSDQSMTGKKVAEVDGPWVVDLHKGGPLPGKGGGNEQSVAIATVANQNLNGNQPFEPTMRYAFGFDILPATMGARNVNLDAQGMTDYQDMIAHGYTVLYVGTATFVGGSCMNTDGTYPFDKLPTTVKFRFGFRSPATYINCQNPDNDPAKGLGAEEHARGVQVKQNETTIAQATVHTDHPFWESFTHDTPAHFDPLAALATKDANGNYTVTLDAVKGVNYTAFKDANGKGLPWRWCRPDLTMYTPPNMAQVMNFDSLGIPYNPAGDPTKVMRDYYDYMTYDQSTQGHLNSDGLCFVQRHYPSPQ